MTVEQTTQTKIRGAFFDFGGTIFNNEQFHNSAVHSAFVEHVDADVFIDDDEFRSNVGLAYEDRILNMLAMRGIDDDVLIANMTKHALEHYAKADRSDALVPGVAEWIKTLHAAGIELAVVTNASRAVVEPQLKEVGLLEYFPTIIGATDVKMLKPHPEPYEKALEQHGFNANEVVVFEDSPVGVEAAWLLDIPVVGILSSYTPDELHKTVKTIHNYNDLTIADVEAAIE